MTLSSCFLAAPSLSFLPSIYLPYTFSLSPVFISLAPINTCLRWWINGSGGAQMKFRLISALSRIDTGQCCPTGLPLLMVTNHIWELIPVDPSTSSVTFMMQPESVSVLTWKHCECFKVIFLLISVQIKTPKKKKNRFNFLFFILFLGLCITAKIYPGVSDRLVPQCFLEAWCKAAHVSTSNHCNQGCLIDGGCNNHLQNLNPPAGFAL